MVGATAVALTVIGRSQTRWQTDAVESSIDREHLTRELLSGFAGAPGRSVHLRVRTPTETAEFGVHADVPRPAASLLKLPLAMAAESAGLAEPGRRIPVGRIGVGDSALLNILTADTAFTVTELIGITIGLSDNDCARWLLGEVGIAAVRDAVAAAGCDATTVATESGRIPLVGMTTARDSVRLIERATDTGRYPVTAHALRHNIHASRVPLGVEEQDITIAHKGGTLTGVAHDAAVLDCDRGQVIVAFLSDAQHDTLVTGYEMGLCTRGVLQTWGLSVRRTSGLT